MKILGIDYGSKRIGLSVADTDMGVAFPKSVLNNDKNLFEELAKIFTEQEIEKIVLGESKDFKMKDNPVMEDILKFKETLENSFKIEVILYPEVLSSHQAAKMSPAFANASTRQGAKKMIDASAATIILQSYLDYKM